MSVPSTQECENIQIIEPDSTLPTSVGGALGDPAIQELGEVALVPGQTVVNVIFQTKKLSAQYRFEYLYVDDFSTTGLDNNPGAIIVVPVTQTVTSFTVELSGTPIGYQSILRWRVVVVSALQLTTEDAPERIYKQLTWKDPDVSPNPNAKLNIFFVNPRSNTLYGFSELRVENLVDDPITQTPVVIQVFEKRLDGFQIAINPVPLTGNYYLVARTP